MQSDRLLRLGIQRAKPRVISAHFPRFDELLLMVEPVAAAVIGAIVGDRLGWQGLVGAALIMAGIALSEVGAFVRRPRLDRAVNGRQADPTSTGGTRAS